jgi:hypothetical protein
VCECECVCVCVCLCVYVYMYACCYMRTILVIHIFDIINIFLLNLRLKKSAVFTFCELIMKPFKESILVQNLSG